MGHLALGDDYALARTEDEQWARYEQTQDTEERE